MGNEQSTQASGEDGNAKRNILLVGTSGRGKSSTGNLIFGSPVFETSDSMDTGSDNIVHKSKEVSGLEINICDALTIRDERMLESDVQKDIKAKLKKCLDACPQGFHFIIFVFSYNTRITREELVATDVLRNEFGARFLNEQAISVFTHGETFDLQQMIHGGPNFDAWYSNTTDPTLKKISKNMKAFLVYNVQTEKMGKQRQKLLTALRNCHMCAPGLQKKNWKGGDPNYGATTYSGDHISSVNSDIALLLIGHTGYGKSSIANTILGKDCFRVSEGSDSGTSKVASARITRNNKTVTVVDSPGIRNANSGIKIRQTLREGFMCCPAGFNALVLVLSCVEELTDAQRKTVNILKRVLGENIFRERFILVFTHGENFGLSANGPTFESWWKNQTGALKDLIDECQPRIVLFSNPRLLQERDESISRLMSFIRGFPDPFYNSIDMPLRLRIYSAFRNLRCAKSCAKS